MSNRMLKFENYRHDYVLIGIIVSIFMAAAFLLGLKAGVSLAP